MSLIPPFLAEVGWISEFEASMVHKVRPGQLRLCYTGFLRNPVSKIKQTKKKKKKKRRKREKKRQFGELGDPSLVVPTVFL